MAMTTCDACVTRSFCRNSAMCINGYGKKEPSIGDAGPARDAVPAPEVEQANPKDLAGRSKPSMGFIPVGAMESVARVMELGARKYGPYNWREQPIKKMTYAHAALRHLFAWIGGEDNDPESLQPHLAHVAACMLIVIDAMRSNACIEDRVWLQKRDTNR